MTTSPEPFASRWKRRARTIPTMVALTTIGIVASPIILVVSGAIDIVNRRPRLPSVRVALFLLQYAINDSVEILLAPVYWMAAGFGTRLDRPTSVRRHERLQGWSVDLLARRAEQLLGLRLAIEPQVDAFIGPGPVIVLCRHVNIVDASIPTLIYQRLGYRTRGVIMAELLADPGFDLIYARTGSVFIPRDNGPEALQMLTDLHRGVDSTTAIVIFPEGRLFRPELLTRFLAKLTETNPVRAQRLAPLHYTLPPRPGGVLSLLTAMPNTDVVVIAHAGLDRFGTFADLARSVPLTDAIRLTAWRIAASDIPDNDGDRIAWLDEQWLRVDRYVGQSLQDPMIGGNNATRHVTIGAPLPDTGLLNPLNTRSGGVVNVAATSIPLCR